MDKIKVWDNHYKMATTVAESRFWWVTVAKYFHWSFKYANEPRYHVYIHVKPTIRSAK